eukprot:3100109-Pleurochrysis_carterae.AAC.6
MAWRARRMAFAAAALRREALWHCHLPKWAWRRYSPWDYSHPVRTRLSQRRPERRMARGEQPVNQSDAAAAQRTLNRASAETTTQDSLQQTDTSDLPHLPARPDRHVFITFPAPRGTLETQ